MDLRRYVEGLREELGVVAEAGGGEARVVAERLIGAVESGVRLMLLNALAEAAGEITRELAPGSVDVRLRGRDPEFVVTVPPQHEPAVPRGASEGATDATVDDGAVARINFRVSEGLKARIEEAAAREGLSVNAWLVRLTSTAVEEDRDGPRRRAQGIGGQGFSGWVR